VAILAKGLLEYTISLQTINRIRDFYLLLNTAIAVALFVIGVVTSINNRKPLVNKLFLVFTSSVGIWLVVACVSNGTRNSAAISLYGNYFVFFFSYVLAYLLLWFAVLVTTYKG
jgi:hypothetical protein